MADSRSTKHTPFVISISIALLLTIVPMPNWLESFRPDWIVLTCVYWAMTFPRSYSIGSAWIVGLSIDVAQGTLLGQHALAISAVIYFTVRFHLLFRQFPIPQLMATVFAMLVMYQFILFWTNGVAGIDSPMIVYWGPVVIGAIIWPIVSGLLDSLRHQMRS